VISRRCWSGWSVTRPSRSRWRRIRRRHWRATNWTRANGSFWPHDWRPGRGATGWSRPARTSPGVAGLLGPVVASFGVAAGSQTIGSAPGGGAFGSAPTAREAIGPAARGPETVGEAGPVESVGRAAGQGTSSLGSAPTEPVDYSTRVDVNGDGLWDDHRAYERADGGVDIHADVDHDGVVNFIGHDYDRDGLIEMAEFDDNLDGVMDIRMYDETGDGWMDRREAIGDEGPTEDLAPLATRAETPDI
jgi:hypothetical protein